MSLTLMPIGPALDVARTRRSVRLLVLRWSAFAVASLALVGTGIWRWIDRDPPVRGNRASGLVVDREERVVGWGATRSGSLTIDVTLGERTQRATVDLGEHIGDYQLGDQVDVVIDPDDPERVAIAGVPSRASGVPAAGVAGVGVLLGATASFGLHKAWWMRRVVDRYAWVPVTTERVEVAVNYGLRERSSTLLKLHDTTGTVIAQRVGVGHMPVALEPVAWVAGLGRARFVIAVVGGAPLFAVKPVRRTG